MSQGISNVYCVNYFNDVYLFLISSSSSANGKCLISFLCLMWFLTWIIKPMFLAYCKAFYCVCFLQGGSVIRMMRFVLGEETFRKGLEVKLLMIHFEFLRLRDGIINLLIEYDWITTGKITLEQNMKYCENMPPYSPHALQTVSQHKQPINELVFGYLCRKRALCVKLTSRVPLTIFKTLRLKFS